MKNIALTLFLVVVVSFSGTAAKVDTVVTFSNAMNKNIKAVVITPDEYGNGKKYPVLYLLHGYGGNFADWLKNAPGIKQLSDLYEMIIVCPDGNVGSWYFDSPIDNDWKYETYVATELVNWIDSKYKTIKEKGARAITGLSMGGHGAFYLAIKHQDVYGAVGSMSGGVDIRPFPKNWDIAKRLGTIEEQPENWKKNSVIGLIDSIKQNSLAISFECGTGDFFFDVNENLHQQLLYRNIAHDYTVRPGVHNWKYWANAIKYQGQFFGDFFKGKQ